DPPFVGTLTTTVVPGTPLAQMQARGEFSLPDQFGMLQELRDIVAGSDFSACRFSANHASNYLPLRADLPRDKEGLVRLLDQVLRDRDESILKPERLRGL
ncbi:MAG: radical SAM protein, partial [Nannocystaceae bacterium]